MNEQYKCRDCGSTFEDSVVLFTDYIRDEQFYGCPHCGGECIVGLDRMTCDGCGVLEDENEEFETVDGCLYCEECLETAEEEEE